MGGAGRRTPSSAPRRGRARAVTSPVDAANVRKSNRPAKPRSLDLLPSGACHLAPGLAAVGRRLKVHWPDEMQWFAGHVAHFDEASGKHHIVYDDGDSEELVLAAERFEWIQTPAVAVNLASPRAAAAEAFLDPLDTSPFQGRLSGRKAAPGAEDGAWPCVGDFLWGRVKVRSAHSTALACTLTRAPFQTGAWVVAWPSSVSHRREAVCHGSVRRVL